MSPNIYQIFYSDLTKNQNDHGFLQLDNLSNERPDWREYWPIRKFLIENELDSNAYYGFFSPKFMEKTGLSSKEVFEFIESQEGDIFLFSPFFDQSAFPINVIEQSGAQHKDLQSTIVESLRMIDPGINASTLLMNSTNTIFCNFFVARKSFWEIWLKYCELIFSVAEENNSDLAINLNANTNHDGGFAPAKVFAIERVASFILATQRQWKVKAFNPMALPYANSQVAIFKNELLILDSLKVAYSHNNFPQYMEAYNKIRADIIKKLKL